MKLADYSQVVTGDQLDAGLRAGGFDGVFHYIRGTAGWVIRIEDPAVVADIRSRGWWQLAIDVPLNPSDADGAAMAAAARAYGYPPGSLMALDVEPSRFVLDPAGWARAADAWCDGVQAGSYSPGPYGNDDTVAACGSRADWIWRAKPGQCDPAGPGLADAFFAGRRIVQCSSGVWGGIEFDVSFSQLTPGGPMAVTGLDPTDITVKAILDRVEGVSWAFAEAASPAPNQGEALAILRNLNDAIGRLIRPELDAVKAELDAIKAELDAGGTVDAAAAIARVEKALQSAGGALQSA